MSGRYRGSGVGPVVWLPLVSMLAALLTGVPTVAAARPPAAEQVDAVPTRVLEPDGGVGEEPSAVAYDARADVLVVLEPGRGGRPSVATIAPSGVPEASGELDLGVDDPAGAVYSPSTGTLVAVDGASGELVTVPVEQRRSRLSFGRPERQELGAEIADPRDLALSPDGGTLYVLDGAGQLIIVYTVEADGSLSSPSTGDRVIDLADAGVVEPAGIAVHPETGDLYVSDAADGTIKQLSPEGARLATLGVDDETSLDPGALTIAPTGDPTDDPDALSLFAVDIDAGTAEGSQLVELSLTASVTAAAAASAPTDPTSVVAITATSDYSPPSPDPSGIAYVPPTDHLEISDGEVNEIPALFTGDNLFAATRDGALADTHSTTAFSDEPTGVAYNPANGHLFYSDDTGTRAIHELDPGADGQAHTGDDVVTMIPTESFGSTDPEGVTFDTQRGHLIMVDGLGEEIYDIDPGSNGVFDGVAPAGDDIVTNFDTTALDLPDPEGVEFNPDNGNLYILSSKDDVIGETTIEGTLLRYLPLDPAASLINPADVAYAPASAGGGNNLYVVDRGIDNNNDPDENDGLLAELSFNVNAPPVVDGGPDLTTTVGTPVTLDGTVSDDGLPDPPGAVTTTWSTVSGPGTVTFGDASSVDTTADFSTAGAYVLRLTADDGDVSSDDDVAVSVVGAGGEVTVEQRVATRSDDAEERPNGSITTNSSDLEMVNDSGGNQTVGMRFTDVELPQGANILTASVQFQVDETPSDPTSLTIRGQASDNPATFTTTAFSISTRPTTTASASWTPPPWGTVGEAGPDQEMSDIATVVQEIVDRPGWSSGNALVLIVTGTGERVAESFNGDAAGAPLLRVQYTSQSPPSVDAGTDQIFSLPTTTADLDGTVTDDELPDPPGAVSTTWSKLSGPGTVTFGDASAVDTTATFSEPGTYVLRLTADDGDLTSSDDVTVTVVAANAAPSVDAGPDATISLPATTTDLDGTVTDEGLPDPPGAVSTTWSKLSGPGTVTFGDASAVDTTATFTEPGTYVLRLTADDGDLTTSDDVTVTLSSVPNQTRQVRISTRNDDAEEQAAGSVNVRNGDLELVEEDSIQTVGLRFPDLDVPHGATIVTATVQFTADETDTVATDLTVRAQAADDAPTFQATAGNISSRPLTTASAAWSPAAWTVVGDAGPAQQTSDLSAVVQEVVDRPGWSSGNALVLAVNGSGKRVAESYDGAAAAAPLLELEYAVPEQQRPQVDAGADATVTLPDTVALDGTVTDDGLPDPPGAVTTTWSKLSGPGTVAFGDASAVDTDATFSDPGTYVLRLVADDGQLSADDTVTIDAAAAGNQIVQSQVAATSDDVEEDAAGDMTMASSDLELVEESTVQTVGLRFTGLTVPPGATIVAATVQFTADETDTVATDLTVRAQAADDAPTFQNVLGDVSSRPLTAASAAWSPAGWTVVGAAGAAQQTSDLSAVVQEVVDRPGWSSGNALVLVVNGSGKRVAESYDGDAASAPVLQLTYSTE